MLRRFDNYPVDELIRVGSITIDSENYEAYRNNEKLQLTLKEYELLKLLAVLTNDPRFEEMLTEEGEKPKDMCEVLDRAEIRGEINGAAGKTLGEMQNSMGGIP